MGGYTVLSAVRRALTAISPYRASLPLIGIEIGTSAVRLVVLERHRHGFFVKTFGVESFHQDGDELDVPAVAASLSRLLVRCGVSSGQVAMVSSAPIMTRLLSLPVGLGDDEIDLHIRLEAHRYVPYPLDEVSFDFWVVGADESGLQVLLVVMREQAVDECVQIAMNSGIELSVLDVQEYALARGLSDTMAGLVGCVCVLHIDETKTHLYAVQIGADGVFSGFDYHKEYLHTVNMPYAVYDDKATMPDKATVPDDASDGATAWHTDGYDKSSNKGDDKNDDSDAVGMDFDTFLKLHHKASPSHDTGVSLDEQGGQMMTQPYEIRFDGGTSTHHDKTHAQKWADKMTDNQTNLTDSSHSSHQEQAQAQKLLKMLTAYESSTQMDIDTVILSGLADEMLVQTLAQISHKSVRLANPFVSMDVVYPMGNVGLSLLPSLVVACGVAMRVDEGVV